MIKQSLYLPDFELIEEIYQFELEPCSRERLRILLHLDPERARGFDYRFLCDCWLLEQLVYTLGA